LDAETIALIQRLARENRLWGAERIRSELLMLGLRVAKRTIQKYLRAVRAQSPTGQTWSTFLKTHGQDIWACDFVPVVTLFFQTLYAFVIVQVGSRRVVHVNATAHPTEEWIAQQLRDATPFEETAKHLICDNDTKFGPAFEAAAKTGGLAVIHTPDAAPRANAICERLWGVYGASAWIICWCSAVANWYACWSSTRGISTRRAPTKAWRSRHRTRASRARRPWLLGTGPRHGRRPPHQSNAPPANSWPSPY
jgi:hypothetical protein